MKPVLYYITDPYCIWCYGFAGIIKRLSESYAGRLRLRVVHGGMIPNDLTLDQMFNRFSDPLGLHQRVTLMSGQSFGAAYLATLGPPIRQDRVLNSTQPARAQAALRRLGVDQDLAVSEAIQHVYYQEGSDLQKVQTYLPIAEQFGIEPDDFRAAYEAPNSLSQIHHDRQLVAQLRIQGFPAVVLKGETSPYVSVAGGYCTYDDLRRNLERALQEYVPGASQGEVQSCSLQRGTC